MAALEYNDVVIVKLPEEEKPRYARINGSPQDGFFEVYYPDADEGADVELVLIDEVEPVEPAFLSLADMQRLCRFELNPAEVRGSHPMRDVVVDGEYRITIEDLLHALKKLRNLPAGDKGAAEWFDMLAYDVSEAIGLDNARFGRVSYSGIDQWIEARACDLFDDIWFDLGEYFDGYLPAFDYDDAISRIEKHLAEAKKPILERSYSDAAMDSFLSDWSNDAVKAQNDPLLIELYRRFVLARAAADNPRALDRKSTRLNSSHAT